MSADLATSRDDLRVDGLQVAIESADGAVLRAVDVLTLALRRGETVALVGESGCGKSLTALTLLRLLPEVAWVAGGSITQRDEDWVDLPESRMRALRGGRIGMVFQEPSTSLNPVLTVGRQVREAVEAHTPLRGAAAQARALDWLARVRLPEPAHIASAYPFQLSGGQQQRVMIAIALAGEPHFLVADEPTTALDVTLQAEVLDLLRELQRERQLGLLLITHDLAVVSGVAQQVALMYAGQIVEVAPAADFFAAPRHPYARLLLQALPDAAARGRPLAAIAGQVPGLEQVHTGCRFAPRCPQAAEACRVAPPELQRELDGRWLRCLRPDGDAGTGRVLGAAIGIDARAAMPPLSADAAPAPAVPLLVVDGLMVAYPQRRGLRWRVPPPRTVVDGVGFALARGRTLALVGSSGSGKSTTGLAIAQLLRGRALTQGQARLDGVDLFGLHGAALRAARREVQLVFQDPNASLDPRQRVGEILGEGLPWLRPDWTAAQREARVRELAERVGLPARALESYPHAFSGGQRQRIAIARALACAPRLLICDEPTSALDVSVQAQILNLLRELQRDLGLALLFITHHLGVVEYLADDVAVMAEGRIVEAGSVDQVLGAPTHGVTRRLLASVPRLPGRS